MIHYLLQKAAQYLIVIVLALTLNFVLPRLMPGDPLQLLAGDDVGRLDAAQRQVVLQHYGLDRPVWDQFVIYMGGALRADFGYSFHEQRPVSQILLERLPWTVALVGLSILFSTSLGVAAGSLAAWRRGRWLDGAGLTLFVFMDSLPAFWLGMLLIVLFAVQLRWFPLFGALSFTQELSGADLAIDVIKHLVLPVATLTLVSTGGMFLITRYALLGVLGEEFILTARAKGLRESRVLFKHALRRAALPIATAVLLRLGQLVGGATVVETTFTYPGLGRLMYQSVLSRDYPVLQGAFFWLAVCMIAANAFADVLYPFLDPRLRLNAVRR